MEWRRRSEADDAEWEPPKRGWCVGSEEFKRNLLEKIDEDLGGNHSGELRRERADVKADRIISEELQRFGWSLEELAVRRNGDPGKLAIENRLRRETVLPVAAIAAKLHLGSPKSARARLRDHKRKKIEEKSGALSFNAASNSLENVAML